MAGFAPGVWDQLVDKFHVKDGTFSLIPMSKPGIPEFLKRRSVQRELMRAALVPVLGGSALFLSDETLDQALCVAEALWVARKYLADALAEETGDLTVYSVLENILMGILVALVVVGATTVLGAALGAIVGAVIGFLVTAILGGEGAVPGAIFGAEVGGELGFEAGVWILEKLGLAMLAVYVGSKMGQATVPLINGLKLAWSAGKFPEPTQSQKVEEAGKLFARAIAILVRLILEGIILYLTARGMAYVMERLGALIGALKQSKLGVKFAEWVERNWKKLLDNPKLREKKPTKSIGEGTEEGGGAVKKSTPPAARPVPPGHTRVYRAVSEAEYQQILRTGKFEQGPNSLEGKWFADSLEGAQAHGKGLYPDGKFRIIEADVPDDAPSLYRVPNLDGHGPARYLDMNDLQNVTPRRAE
jgi:hypothetical protein